MTMNERAVLYWQFDEMFTIIPHYPKYCYINTIFKTGIIKKKPSRKEANIIFSNWQDSRREVARLWSGSKSKQTK
jgi:hypothetical protein